MATVKRLTALALTLAVCVLAAGCKTEDQIQEQRLVSSTQEAANYYDTRSVLNVLGEGVVIIEPDTAEVGFTVYQTDADAEVAQQNNAKLMSDVMRVIRSKGIPQEDIETGRLRIHEVYDYEKSPAEIVRYDVYYSVKVTVRDMDILGALVSECIAAGATQVDGPVYSVTDDTEAYMQALSMAVEAAKEKATIMASSAGVRLSALPLSINEQNGENHAVKNQLMAADMAAEEAAEAEPLTELEISVPQIEVTARVEAVYQITR